MRASKPTTLQLASGIAIALAAVWTWLEIPRIHHPLGSDWAQYFTVAEILWHDDPHLYPPFRKPFFGMVLGLGGEHLGYLNAAQLLGRLSAVAIVIASGIGAWALVGPLAGAVAAAVAVLMPLIMDGALWVNNYPMLGATSGLAIAAGAACARWPRVGWALLAGVAAGVAHALDVRGLMVVPAVVVLVGLGLPWGDWGRCALLSAMLLVPMGSLHAYDAWLTKAYGIPQFTLEGQMRVQRQTVLEPIRRGQYVDSPGLQSACARTSSHDTPERPWSEALTMWTEGSCASAIRSYSYGPLEANRILPGPLTLLLLPLTLLPMAGRKEEDTRRSRLRSTLSSLVVFGVPAASILVGMGWVFYFDRYLLPSAAILAMLVPVGLGRLAGIFSRAAPGLRWTAAGAALVWAAMIWPGLDARSLQAPEAEVSADLAAGVMAQWAREEVADGDRIFDCGGLALDYLLLPRRLAYVRHPPGSQACEALIRQPGAGDAQTYLVTPVLPGRTDLAARPMEIETLGWVAIRPPATLQGYRLWLYQGT